MLFIRDRAEGNVRTTADSTGVPKQYCADKGVPHVASNAYQMYVQCGCNVSILDDF